MIVIIIKSIAEVAIIKLKSFSCPRNKCPCLVGIEIIEIKRVIGSVKNAINVGVKSMGNTSQEIVHTFENVRGSLEMVPKGSVKVATNPKAADVFLDGVMKGVTPLMIKMCPKEYII